MSKTLISHVSVDVNGNATGGSCGSLSNRDICIRTWYYKDWTVAYIPASFQMAEDIASTAENMCRNTRIIRGNENTLYDIGMATKWDIQNVTEMCSVDTVTFVSICLNAAGIYVPKNTDITQIQKYIKQTGLFNIRMDDDIVKKQDKLTRGTILVGKDHIAVVITDGSGIDRRTAEQRHLDLISRNKSLVGKELTTGLVKSKMDVFVGPNEKFQKIDKVVKDDTVHILEFLVDGWTKIVFPQSQSGYGYIKGIYGTTLILADESILDQELVYGDEVSPYEVYLIAACENVRTGPGKNFNIFKKIPNRTRYTIVRECEGWGMLEDGIGWINLKNTNRILRG